MGVLHKHDWSSWVAITQEHMGHYMFGQAPTFWKEKGVGRICLSCAKEEEHWGDMWRTAYDRGELGAVGAKPPTHNPKSKRLQKGE